MKRFSILLLLIVIILSCDRTLHLDDQTIAIVGKHVITFDAYKERYLDFLYLSLMKDNLVTRRQIAQNMINEILLKHYDDNSALENDAHYHKDRRWSANQMLLGFLKDQEVYAKIEVEEAEIRRAFQYSNEQIAARHLYATTEEEALRLYNALQQGAHFEQLAYDVFTDSTLKNNGGFIGYFTWGDMDPSFEETAFRLAVGEISRPVKTAQGYSIIKLEDRIPHPLLTETEYQNKRSQFERLVRISKKKKYENQYLTRFFDEQNLVFSDYGIDVLWERLRKVNQQSETTDLKAEVLRYGNRSYSISDLIQKTDQIPDYHLHLINSKSALKTVLKGLLIQEKFLEQAYDLRYDRHPEVIKATQNADNNLFIKYKRRKIAENTDIPDSLLRVYYREHIDDFSKPPRINVHEILLDNQQQALRIKGQLLSGSDFAYLAQQYSLRPWSAARGGEMGLSEIRQFGSLADRLWNAPLNQIIGPIEIQGLWGIFKVTEKIDAQPREYEDAIGAVTRQYKKDHEASIVFNYLVGLNRIVDIQVNEELIRWFYFDDPILN